MVEHPATRRLQWLLWTLLLWVGAIFGRLVWLQVFAHDDLVRLAQQQQERTVEIQAQRGTIFDRRGQPLARSIPAESVCVNPKRIKDPGVAADLLARVLNLDRNALYLKLRAASVKGSGFLWIKRKVPFDEAEGLRGLHLDWVEFRPELKRFYPNGTLGSHVVGSTGNVDGADDRGNSGIELAFDDDLAGRPGVTRVYTDVKQNPYDSEWIRKPEAGANLTLTIDPNLQFIAERELDRGIRRTGAATGSIVVIDPKNGDILAMANFPRFDPNGSPKAEDPPFARSNLAIGTPFEPGSVFKVVTLTAALESTFLTPDTLINCGNGQINLFGRVIRDDHRYAALTLADVLAKSSNIGAIQVALRVGEKNLYAYQRKFGFGQKTGIELPGESAGLLRRTQDWGPSSIGSLAMGHEISVTSLQLAVAGAVIANGGLKVKPRLILARQRPNEPVEQYVPDKPERIIRPETAIKMRRMMEGVVLRGTARGLANLPGNTSGGKTGSAQIFDAKTHTYTHTYNASFLGFAPVANPQVVIAVTLHRTTVGTAGYGGPAAAPVFREVAIPALRMLDVPKDLPESPGAVPVAPVDTNDLPIAGLGVPPAGLDRVESSVTPPPVRGEDASSLGRRPFFSQEGNRSLIAASTTPTPSAAGQTVPDFRGMTLRAVLEESAAAGVPVEARGVGFARSQDPPAGSPLPHTPIRVQFGK